MRIRKASTKDMREISELAIGQLDFHSQFSAYYQPIEDIGKRITLGKRYFTKTLKDRKTLFMVAEHKGRVAGFAIGKIIKSPPPLKMKQTGDVSEVYIIKEYRGKGLGPAMVLKILAWFRRMRVRQAVVLFDHHNEMARKAYRKVGFRPFQEKYSLFLD